MFYDPKAIMMIATLAGQCAVPLDSTGSLGARSYPLSYVYSGYYYWVTGRLYYQTLIGDYWSSSIVSSTNSYNLNMGSTRLLKANSVNKRLGYALRCVARY